MSASTTQSAEETKATNDTMKTIATIQTYDPYDATSTGYDITVRDNGTMRLVSRSRWQNSYTGRVYITDTPPEIQAAIDAEGEEDQPDIETAVSDWLVTQHAENWRKVRNGYKVR